MNEPPASAGTAIQDLVPHSNCWGCGPLNEGGLHLKSYDRGGEVVAEWQPGPPFFAGPEGVLNGGIIATLLDCHGICAAIADCYRREERDIGTPPDIWCVTAALNITYVQPTPIDLPVRLIATMRDRGARRTTVDSQLLSGGEVCARADVIAVRVRGGWGESG
jgi:acyl-coenzyme A thioesterase PaaI-like protein